MSYGWQHKVRTDSKGHKFIPVVEDQTECVQCQIHPNKPIIYNLDDKQVISTVKTGKERFLAKYSKKPDDNKKIEEAIKKLPVVEKEEDIMNEIKKDNHSVEQFKREKECKKCHVKYDPDEKGAGYKYCKKCSWLTKKEHHTAKEFIASDIPDGIDSKVLKFLISIGYITEEKIEKVKEALKIIETLI
jgi:hypothetical protein